MKIYPCEVVPWTKIEKWYNDGTYKPYGNDKAVMKIVLAYAMKICPPWIRLPRVVRDIPHEYITGGLKCGNMRQVIQDEKQFQSNDIRYREIGRHPQYMIENSSVIIRKYKASQGTEYFISVESEDRKAVYGFIRLRIPPKSSNIAMIHRDTLENKGLIRELHVYGSLQRVHEKSTKKSIKSQHRGIGKRLLKEAENIAKYSHMCTGVVVISGIGVREYYEKQGYILQNHYMVKEFPVFAMYRTCIDLLNDYWVEYCLMLYIYCILQLYIIMLRFKY